MKVLVTGGAGFIGSHLVERLLNEPTVTGVRVADNLATGRRENIQPFLDRIEFIEGDLGDENVRARAVTGVEVIFHEAAIPSVPRSVEAPVENHLNGAHLTLLMLDSARRHNVRRFIYAGSSSAYGESERLPKVEDMAPAPLSPYAASKLAGEHYVAAFAKCYALDAVTLRYFNVFGPRQDPASPYSGVLARFCAAFQGNGDITIFGDGEQSRDFTYVADVVQANFLAAQAPGRLAGQVLNVGTGQAQTLNAIVRALNELTGARKVPRYAPARTGDVRHSLADISRARKVLGFEPRVNFKDGLLRTLQWYGPSPLPSGYGRAGGRPCG
jgi:UDP-glucose 4-epimerase